jgi:hypothetical protein
VKDVSGIDMNTGIGKQNALFGTDDDDYGFAIPMLHWFLLQWDKSKIDFPDGDIDYKKTVIRMF